MLGRGAIARCGSIRLEAVRLLVTADHVQTVWASGGADVNGLLCIGVGRVGVGVVPPPRNG